MNRSVIRYFAGRAETAAPRGDDRVPTTPTLVKWAPGHGGVGGNALAYDAAEVEGNGRRLAPSDHLMKSDGGRGIMPVDVPDILLIELLPLFLTPHRLAGAGETGHAFPPLR